MSRNRSQLDGISPIRTQDDKNYLTEEITFDFASNRTENENSNLVINPEENTLNEASCEVVNVSRNPEDITL